MGDQEKDMRAKLVILGFYSAGIIVGGGILALPFVAMDTGSIMLILLLIAFGLIFYVIYNRMLDSISACLRGVSVIKPGLVLYDAGLIESGLEKYGKLAFTIGILLYVVPADIVYILYGLKSLIQLSSYVNYYQIYQVLFIGLVVMFIVSVLFMRFRKLVLISDASSYELVLKLLLMISIWVLTIGLLKYACCSEIKIAMGASAFALSLIIGEFFPERFKKASISMPVAEDVLPRHKAGAYMSVFKLLLITLTPFLAFLIIASRASLSTNIPLFPRSLQSLVAATTIIIFMYVGSGIYNILVYDWIINHMERGKKVTLIAITASLIAYLVFSILILLSVDPVILINSNLRREHAFIALARKLEAIGITELGLLVIIMANIFALVSVSVAFLGFTDTLSDRLELDLKVNRNLVWTLVAILITSIVVTLEVFDVTRIATDALGIAGNAGGGLFILILPWLIKDSKNRRRIPLAIAFLLLVTLLDISMILNSITFVAFCASTLATILVLFFGILAILEAMKNA